MLLGGQDEAGLVRGLDDRVRVERLDRRDVEDVGGDALLGQQVRRLERPPGLDVRADDGDVAALAEEYRLADLEAVVDAEDGRRRVAVEPQVDRAGLQVVARIACRSSTPSAGATTVMFGIARMTAMSWTDWWVLPVLEVRRPE